MSSVFDDMIRRVYANRGYERQGEDVGKHAAREIFLRTVHRIEPRVVGDLMDAPLDLYRPMFASSIAGLSETQRSFSWIILEKSPSWGHFKHAWERDPSEVHQLRDLLLRWSRKWRLWDEWCLESAVETLALLSAGGEHPNSEPLHYAGSRMIEMPFSDDELRFDFSHHGWQPVLEDWANAERQLDDAFRRAKQEYRQRVEAMCLEEGLAEVRSPRNRAGDHFEWLVRFQVCRESWVEIAAGTKTKNGEPATDDAVAKAVKAKAALIELTLAEVERTGRRPGKAA